MLRTHSRIPRVNRALGNGARLHNGNDIDLVLNLIDFTVRDAPHHFREEPHRVYVRRATSIFRERPAEGLLQKLFGFEWTKPCVLSGVLFSDRAQSNPLRIRECADCVGDLVAGSNGCVGAVTRTKFGRVKIGGLSSGSGRGGGSPRPERFVSKDAERAAGCEMALEVERVLDGDGQKALG